MSISHFSPQGSGIYIEEGVKKVVSARDGRWLQGNRVLQTQHWKHIWAHRGCKNIHTQDLYKLKPDKILAWKEKGNHEVPPLGSYRHLVTNRRAKSASLMAWPLVYKPTSRAGQEEPDNTKWTAQVFGFVQREGKKEKTWSWVGRAGPERSWVNIIKEYCMEFSKNKNVT